MDEPLTVFFSVTTSDDPTPMHFQLSAKDDPLKVGRNKKSGIVVNKPGVSWVHLEIKFSPETGGLLLRDLSTNGVGLRSGRNDTMTKVEKEVDTELPSGAAITLPFRIRPTQGELQTTLTFSIDGVDSPSSELTESEEAVEVVQERKGKRKKPEGKDKGKEKKKKVKHEFTAGQFVRVVGLKAKGELNGKVGLLMEWDEGNGYWKVRMEDGTGKAFRPANLEPHKAEPPKSEDGPVVRTIPPPPPDEPAPATAARQVPPGPPGPPANGVKPKEAAVPQVLRLPILPTMPATMPPMMPVPMPMPTMMPMLSPGLPLMPPMMGLPLPRRP